MACYSGILFSYADLYSDNFMIPLTKSEPIERMLPESMNLPFSGEHFLDEVNFRIIRAAAEKLDREIMQEISPRSFSELNVMPDQYVL